ncbi:ATP-binding protein [Aeoliella sp. ICT_H6.2]|uniref:histidine kinase n=1 Tax=Aeoliella straminimaris TaxID=2954799 RepID=A0A9X2FCH2_9BACT|nr:ATP-binding protein [Aeoliella straminimaris]MCO6045608.1 ATP-binding protein [Aeoliella straminimaris]
MFHENQPSQGIAPRWAIAGLALTSLSALLVTAWILMDFSREIEILKQLSSHLPASDLPEATELAGNLRLQWRLAVVLVLNTVALSVAVVLLVRAYISSESSLRVTKVLATDILASIDQGIITTDQNAEILSINPCGELLLWPAEDMEDQNRRVFPAAHQTLATICQKVLQTHASIRDKDYVVENDGHAQTLRAGCTLLRDHRHRLIGTVIHVRNVTEKVLIEQRLLRMERYMSLGSLAAGLQHEIKNPLSALTLHVQLLREGLEEGRPSSETQATLGVLEEETRRITRVLEGFRDFASVDKLNLSPVNLRSFVEKVIRLVGPQAERAGVEISLKWPDEEMPTVSLDPIRMEQVLLNLVLNAMAAMPGGGNLQIQVDEDNDFIALQVIDSGSGIPKDLQDKVFDPYFTTRNTGTGMGLAICEKIVRQHNGIIDFESGSHGTTFTITLPAQAHQPIT